MRRITEVPRWQQPEISKIRLDGLPGQPFALEVNPVPGSELVEFHFVLTQEEGSEGVVDTSPVSTGYILRNELERLHQYLQDEEVTTNLVSESGLKFLTYNGPVGDGDDKEIRRQVAVNMKDLDGKNPLISRFSADALAIILESLIPSEEPETPTG